MANRTVHAVMRGTELIGLYETEAHAQWKAADYNSMYKRGKRATVVLMPVHNDPAEGTR